jgi:hypothetical protein
LALLAIGLLDSLMVGTPFLRHAYDRVPSHFDYAPSFRQLADGDFDFIAFTQPLALMSERIRVVARMLK